MQSDSYLEPSISPIGAKLFICVAHPIWEHTFDDIHQQTHPSAVWHDDSNFFVCQVCHSTESPLVHVYDIHALKMLSLEKPIAELIVAADLHSIGKQMKYPLFKSLILTQ
jgi:hypothetical protein